ncbi:MAG: dipeptide epimerase [Ignavibacteriae bacterium]|nr:dipeptide epimerase [Ignavibacteriota bacterium]
MKLSFKPYTLELKHTFTISSNSRTTTPVVLTQIEHEGNIGYGEASMPPYLGESHESVLRFLSKLNLEQFNDPFLIDDILDYVDKTDEKNTAAKASVDIALHDLVGKLLMKPWFKIWGYNKSKTPFTTFTIGIDKEEILKQKITEAEPYKILKIKLGSEDDKKLISTIRKFTNKPLAVDANQGWKAKDFALDLIYWLQEQNVQMIEQPMPKDKFDETAWLTENSPLPIFADEAVQRLSDVISAKGIYSGINIKLMKCTGMREANKMLNLAKSFGMKVMIGCMTETSCAISAAAQLSPQVDWADLDGNLLIKNDPYRGIEIIEGRIGLNESPGIGLL